MIIFEKYINTVATYAKYAKYPKYEYACMRFRSLILSFSKYN